MGIAIFDLVLLGLLSAMQPFIGLLQQDKSIALDIRILVIPAFQSKMVSAKTYEDGRVSAGLFMGNITTNFPEGIVVLEAPTSPENQGLVRLI